MNMKLSYETLYKKEKCHRKIEVEHFKNNKTKCLVCDNFTSPHMSDIRTHLHEVHEWKVSA